MCATRMFKILMIPNSQQPYNTDRTIWNRHYPFNGLVVKDTTPKFNSIFSSPELSCPKLLNS